MPGVRFILGLALSTGTQLLGDGRSRAADVCDNCVDVPNGPLLADPIGGNQLDANLNGDGGVDFLDLGLLTSQFFQLPGPSGLPCARTVPCP